MSTQFFYRPPVPPPPLSPARFTLDEKDGDYTPETPPASPPPPLRTKRRRRQSARQQRKRAAAAAKKEKEKETLTPAQEKRRENNRLSAQRSRARQKYLQTQGMARLDNIEQRLVRIESCLKKIKGVGF